MPKALAPQSFVPSKRVLADLPALRSGLSREEDSLQNWRRRLIQIANRKWFQEIESGDNSAIAADMNSALNEIRGIELGRGGEFIACQTGTEYAHDWFTDPRLGGVTNHSTRVHIIDDLYRYLYAASFGRIKNRSPRLRDFPPAILPNHANVKQALGTGFFSDRFRVQLENKPATTVTSHISKDGHYYIHPDPMQCRSLTVREAARLQTFPDNYFFCGSRTSQYNQVGNAVPPMLAYQIADIVHDLLKQSGVVS